MKRKQINCWIPDEVFEKIELKAARLGMKPSTYGSKILDTWATDDIPLTPIESELAKLLEKEKKKPSTAKQKSAGKAVSSKQI
jgi:hypothetical protein